jgi:hypothetical protein
MGRDCDVTLLSPEERVASVGPLIIDKAHAFWDGLGAREQANYDVEDIILELWIEIRSKDCFYDAARGKYTTFSMDLSRKYLSELRNRLKPVHSPRNADGRLKTMSIEGRTAKAILASMKDQSTIGDVISEDDDSADVEAEDADRLGAMRAKMLSIALDMFTTRPTHLRVIILSYGLTGRELCPSEIGRAAGLCMREVLALRREAEIEIAAEASWRAEFDEPVALALLGGIADEACLALLR